MLVLQALHVLSVLAAMSVDHLPAVQSVHEIVPSSEYSEYPPAAQSEQRAVLLLFVNVNVPA